LIRRWLIRFTDVPAIRRNALDVVIWWEKRRIAYNLVVGLAGVASLTIAVIFLTLPPRVFVSSYWDYPIPDGFFAIFAVILFAIAANVCYTLGWIAELGLRKLAPDRARRLSTLAIKAGFVFSVIIIFGYAGLCGAHWVFRVVATGGFSHHPVSRSEIVGTYGLNSGDDELELRANGSYVSTSTEPDGRRIAQSGDWTYHDFEDGSSKVELSNFSPPAGADGNELTVENAGQSKHLVFYNPDKGSIFYRN